jgi:hypothetical protein
MQEKIQINLNKDEAIVLFEFLSRFSNKDKLEIADQSEARVLWNILCDLEKKLVEPFSEKYTEILEESREKIRDKI